jgi:divalent metal cation (Fe/Co/Zn/Cd) transporter
MALAIAAVLMVTGVTIVLGAVGYLIDRSAARHERERNNEAW